MATRELMRIDDGALVVSVVTDDLSGEVQSIAAVNTGSRAYVLTATDPRNGSVFSVTINAGQQRSLSGPALRNRRLRCFVGGQAVGQPLEALLAAVAVEVSG